ncbi:MAG: M56 family metallopeptidase, partial [Flavobacteriales bacterium]
MILYILKSATCLALLLAFYHLVLEREKMHNFNRFYLLGSVLFSFLAPLYIIYIDVAPLILKTTPTTSFSYPTEITPEIIIEKSIDYTLIFIGIYSLISSILFIRFGKNLFHIIQKIRKNKQVKYQKAVLVLVDDAILPHTFWNYIFINKNDFENQKIEQELFTHELTHVTQKHTLDVLLLEFLQAIFWINPFFILLKKVVQLNHEFLADETVINQHKNTIQYQHLLLNKAAWKNDYYLASNLNYSLTKKRLKMMTTQSSQTKIWIKKLAVIPLLAGFIFLFAERVEAQEIIEIKEEPIKTIYEQVDNSQFMIEQFVSNKGEQINTGFIDLNGVNHYFVTVDNTTKYYNKDGQLADRTGKILSNKKANSMEVIPDYYIKRTYYNNKVFCEFYDDKSSKKAKWQNLSNDDKIQIIEVREEDRSKEATEKYKKAKENLNPNDIRVKLKDINSLHIIYLDKATIIEKSIASKKQMNELADLIVNKIIA